MAGTPGSKRSSALCWGLSSGAESEQDSAAPTSSALLFHEMVSSKEKAGAHGFRDNGTGLNYTIPHWAGKKKSPGLSAQMRENHFSCHLEGRGLESWGAFFCFLKLRGQVVISFEVTGGSVSGLLNKNASKSAHSPQTWAQGTSSFVRCRSHERW